MKWVWVSMAASMLIVAVAVTYSYHRQQEITAIEQQVSAIMEIQSEPIVAVKPARVETLVETHDHASDTNALNLDEKTLSDEGCCPEEEANELYGFHAGGDTVFEGGGESTVKSKTVQLTGDALLRQILTKEFGDDPEIDKYIALSHRIGDGTHKGLATMLEWARLECKFNWSQDAQALYDDFAELAENPELVTEFSFR